MASKEFNLSVEHREKLGTTGAHALRAAGKVPAVLYGHGAVAEHIAVDARAFEELVHRAGRNAILTLTDGGRKRQTALVREIQRHPVSRRVIHADLQRVSADETIDARLAIVTVGVAEGVRNTGAVMDVITHELEVEGPASRIPEHLEVDVTALGIHDHISAGDIVLPRGLSSCSRLPRRSSSRSRPRAPHASSKRLRPPTEAAPEPEVIGEAEPTAPEAQ